MNTNHTPTPWKWDGEDLWHFGVSYDDETDPHRYVGIKIERSLVNSPILKASMEFVTRACNSHDALVAAAKRVEARMIALDSEDQEAMRELSAAIAKATLAQAIEAEIPQPEGRGIAAESAVGKADAPKEEQQDPRF